MASSGDLSFSVQAIDCDPVRQAAVGIAKGAAGRRRDGVNDFVCKVVDAVADYPCYSDLLLGYNGQYVSVGEIEAYVATGGFAPGAAADLLSALCVEHGMDRVHFLPRFWHALRQMGQVEAVEGVRAAKKRKLLGDPSKDIQKRLQQLVEEYTSSTTTRISNHTSPTSPGVRVLEAARLLGLADVADTSSVSHYVFGRQNLAGFGDVAAMRLEWSGQSIVGGQAQGSFRDVMASWSSAWQTQLSSDPTVEDVTYKLRLYVQCPATRCGAEHMAAELECKRWEVVSDERLKKNGHNLANHAERRCLSQTMLDLAELVLDSAMNPTPEATISIAVSDVEDAVQHFKERLDVKGKYRIDTHTQALPQDGVQDDMHPASGSQSPLPLVLSRRRTRSSAAHTNSNNPTTAMS